MLIRGFFKKTFFKDPCQPEMLEKLFRCCFHPSSLLVNPRNCAALRTFNNEPRLMAVIITLLMRFWIIKSTQPFKRWTESTELKFTPHYFFFFLFNSSPVLHAPFIVMSGSIVRVIILSVIIIDFSNNCLSYV